MEKLKDKIVEWCAFGFALLAYALMVIGIMKACETTFPPKEDAKTTRRDTVTVTVTDTVRHACPVVVRDTLIRYVRATLPVSRVNDGTEMQHKDSLVSANRGNLNTPDSIEVSVPITQRVYRDSDYTAWVSGYDPRLDSIDVYRRQRTVTITERVTSTRRWSAGITAGYGYGLTHRRMEPFVGIGLTYRLIPP